MAKTFDGPPTLERSGSEHRRAVTSLALLERARAWEWVKDPLFARGGQGSRITIFLFKEKLAFVRLSLNNRLNIMKSYFSIKPGATFFLGSSRTLVYHKDDVEIIYKTKTPSGKTYYAHVYLMLGGENSVTLYADWGDYFLHMSSIKDQEHFFGIMKRPCPTFVQIWQSEHPDNIFVMSANAGQTIGLGMDIENVDYRNLAPTSLPFHPLVELGLDKFIDAVNKLYVELNSHCPLKLWKDRLVAVWRQETL